MVGRFGRSSCNSPAARMSPGLRNTPPWNIPGIGRGRGISRYRDSRADANLAASVKCAQRQSTSHAVTEIASDVPSDSEEKNQQIKELQDELNRLRTKKRNRESASSSSSSSGNSSASSRRSSIVGKVSSKSKMQKIVCPCISSSIT